MQLLALIAMLALPNAISALPWSGAHEKSQEHMAVDVPNEDITIHIKVGEQKHTPFIHVSKNLDGAHPLQICWMLCAADDLKCPAGWASKQFGDCYTCCKDDTFEL